MVQQVELEKAFHAEMVRIYERIRDECGWRPVRFLQKVRKDGGVLAAKSLLLRKPTSGLTKLQRLGRWDLTAETLVLDSRFKDLFSGSEREKAGERLKDFQAAAARSGERGMGYLRSAKGAVPGER